jgi:uncharacterized membrane protein YcjF (UPF0283 family)
MRPSQWEWPWKALALVLFALAMWGSYVIASWWADDVSNWISYPITAIGLYVAVVIIVRDWLAGREHRRRADTSAAHQGASDGKALSGDLILPPASQSDPNAVGVRRSRGE